MDLSCNLRNLGRAIAQAALWRSIFDPWPSHMVSVVDSGTGAGFLSVLRLLLCGVTRNLQAILRNISLPSFGSRKDPRLKRSQEYTCLLFGTEDDGFKCLQIITKLCEI
jgi:hypothetical protein